jgi:hypothetical protein
MTIGRISCIAALALVAAGCKGSGAGADGGGAAGGGGVKGLANANNDAAIVAAAKKAMACTWKGDSTSFDTDCADWKAWTATNDIYTTAGSDGTFINMVEDPDVKVRLLASEHLGYDSDRKWVSDAALSSRVIAAAAAETQPHYEVDALGKAVARVQYAKTGNWAAAKKALEGTALASMRRNALDWLLDFNETNSDVWDWVKSKTKDADKNTAEGAVYGFVGLTTRRAEACKVWADLLADDRVGGDCASDICSQGECTAFFDPTLDATEGRAKSGNAPDSDWPIAMSNLARNVKASDAQKKRADTILNELATNTHVEGYVRASAIRNMYEVDHAKGKALAARFIHDKDSSIESAAKDVLAKK